LYRFAETSFDQASTGTALHFPFPSAALFSLKTFLVQNPQDIFALHLMSLLLERDHQPEAALDTLQLVSEILEQQYEESEDPDILHRFCIVKSDIGRLALGIEDFETAIENSSTALDLSQDLEGLQKTRLSSQITLGLGRYFLGQMDDAIAAFQTVLADSNEDPDVMLLVTRALWAAGGDQEREIAIQQLKDRYKLIRFLLTATVLRNIRSTSIR
jgi:superkiller protein 3